MESRQSRIRFVQSRQGGGPQAGRHFGSPRRQKLVGGNGLLQKRSVSRHHNGSEGAQERRPYVASAVPSRGVAQAGVISGQKRGTQFRVGFYGKLLKRRL